MNGFGARTTERIDTNSFCRCPDDPRKRFRHPSIRRTPRPHSSQPFFAAAGTEQYKALDGPAGKDEWPTCIAREPGAARGAAHQAVRSLGPILGNGWLDGGWLPPELAFALSQTVYFERRASRRPLGVSDGV